MWKASSHFSNVLIEPEFVFLQVKRPSPLSISSIFCPFLLGYNWYKSTNWFAQILPFILGSMPKSNGRTRLILLLQGVLPDVSARSDKKPGPADLPITVGVFKTVSLLSSIVC